MTYPRSPAPTSVVHLTRYSATAMPAVGRGCDAASTSTTPTAFSGRVAGTAVETRVAVNETHAFRVQPERLTAPTLRLGDVPEVTLRQGRDTLWLFRIVGG